MYEQFHALGDIDITKEPMEVYPTIHYVMGGVRADPETCATTMPGLFAAGEVAAGLHGAESARRQLALRHHRVRQARGRGRGGLRANRTQGAIDPAQIETERATLLSPSGERRQARTPTSCIRSCRRRCRMTA